MTSTRIIINVLDRTGHTELTCDLAEPETVEQIKTEWTKLLTRGFVMAGFPDGPQREGVQMREFDPTIAFYTAIPQMVGG